MAELDDLDATVRRADPDRWLSARFVADRARRAELIALYALNDELARVAEQVSTPMLGDIRLAWWREGLEAAAGDGPVREHPVLRAVAPALRGSRLDLARMEALVWTRAADLESEPFADEASLVSYIDGTAGALMVLAARLLDPAVEPGSLVAAGRAWGWAGLWRAGPSLAARNRRWTPLAWRDADEAEIAAHVAHRVADAGAEARDQLAGLPVAAFPAVAYATLALPYLRRPRLGDLEKRARMIRAVATGKV